MFDAVGKSSFRKTRRLLKKKGIYTATDARGAHIPFLGVAAILGWMLMGLLYKLWPGRKMVFLLPHKDPEGIRYLKEFIASGRFRPVIDRTYPLDRIVEAYRFVETGQKVGNMVIEVGLSTGRRLGVPEIRHAHTGKPGSRVPQSRGVSTATHNGEAFPGVCLAPLGVKGSLGCARKTARAPLAHWPQLRRTPRTCPDDTRQLVATSNERTGAAVAASADRGAT